jgi:hypothetical protein
MASEAAGFWSYFQQDNDGDHGRILDLATDLREQYRLLTAEDLELFVDRESIPWGEAWKDRIDNAIAGTTFFLPVLTPSYFRSPECRRELLKFAREAERLGLGELLMSVHWVRVPELENNPEQSPDEVIRFVAKYNWQPLLDERLEDRGSAVYRKAVAKLAAKLVERAEQARQVEDAPITVEIGQAVDEPEGDGAPGILERIVVGEDAMERASALLQEIGQCLERINEKLTGVGADIDAAAKRGQGMKAVLTLTNRLAGELSQPAGDMATSGHEYSQVLSDLDSGVRARFQLIEATDDPAAEGEQFLRELIELEAAALQGQEGLEELLASAAPVAEFSRSLRAPLEDMRSGLRGVVDGNVVISEWAERARHLLGDEKGHDPAEHGDK